MPQDKRKPKLVGDLIRTVSTAKRPPKKLVVPIARPISFLRRKMIAAVFFVMVVAGLFVVLTLPEARIRVQVRTEPVARDLEIRVEAKSPEPSVSDLVVPGQLITQEVSGQENFAVTGSRNIGEKASGFVQLYNFSKNTLILKSDTTVLTAGGRQYLFTQDVSNIRPTALIGLEEQEVDPSSLTAPVPVVAAAPGEEYNLARGTRIEISNEVFGSQPEVLYGTVSDSEIIGGSTRTIKVVTEADILTALDKVKNGLLEQARGELADSGEDKQFNLLDSGVVTNVIEQAVSKQPGETAESFSASVRMELQALAYDEQDVLEILKERIRRLLPENKTLVDSFARLESRFVLVNLQEGLGVLRNHYEGQLVYRINESELRQRVKGKSAEEIGELLLSRPEIAGVEVKFYPFWIKQAPRFSKKIYIEVLDPG